MCLKILIRFILIVFTVFKSFEAFSQKEAYNWYFGQNAGITFHATPPAALTDGQLTTYEGCASISDNLGNLLFYTDGVQVWNRNHSIMPNGYSLVGTYSSTQCLIIPYPGRKNLYYIFTTPGEAGNFYGYSYAAYSIVDMDLQGGMGDVLTKNVPLFGTATEKLTAVKHRNNTDIWLIAHQWNSNKFYSYLITQVGISLFPVISNVGTVHSSDVGGHNAIGYMKASPDGKKLALAITYKNVIELFDFNNLTGAITNSVVLSSSFPDPYGIEFSSNGKKLYCSLSYGKILQYDLAAGSTSAIVNSVKEIYSTNMGYEILGALQIGPDEKIYVSVSATFDLGVIHNPNIAGVGCNYSHKSLYNGGTAVLGLPGFLVNYFFPFDYRFTCYGDTTEFYLQTSLSVDSVYWNFGDSFSGTDNISRDVSPKHVFSGNGIFMVTLIRYYNDNSDTLTKEVFINHALTDLVNLGGDTSICPGDHINYDLTQPDVTYLWQDGSTSPIYGIFQEGTYWVEAKDYCGTSSDTIEVTYHPVPVVDLGNDTTLCEGTTLFLDVSQPPSSYQWQDGSVNSFFNVTTPGEVFVQVTNSFGCSASDTVVMAYLQPPSINLGKDTTWCQEIPLVLNAYYSQSVYLWQDNSSNSNYQVALPGEYYVEVTNKCGSDKDTILINFRDCSIFIPNLITPDNDLHNDRFIIRNIEVWKGSLEIYNRWGDRVYYNSDYQNNWSGENESKGVYYYYFKDGIGREWVGWVEVVK